MKKVILPLAVLAVVISAHAQEDNFGIKAGANVANLVGDDVSSAADPKLGWYFGAFAEFAFTDQFSIQPELVYSRQGTQSEIAGFDTKAKYNYLNIPILAKYYVTEGLSVTTGPQLGILLAANVDIESPTGDEETDVKDQLKGTDLSWALGAAYKLPNGLSIGARYNLGLSNLPDEGDNDKVRNGVFQIGVSYGIGL